MAHSDMTEDITGDLRADILVTSPWGLGLLGLSGTSIVESAQAANGSRLGEWLLNTADNSVELRADVDGDGIGEILMTSPWGIGVLKFWGGALHSIAMGQNGSRVGGWIINTADNQFLHAGDVDGDGREEILVTSPWGIGLLKAASGLTTLMLHPNGTRFGGWLLNTADNSFPLMADVDGDGRAEIVVTSPWGLGVLKVSGAGLTSIVMAPNGTSFGDWTLDTATDSVEVAADLTGDGRADLVIRNGSRVAVLRFDGAGLRTAATATHGDDLGGWQLDVLRDKLGVAGDFDGAGRAEILVTGDAGLALVGVVDGRLATSLVAANGTRFGGWLLNTKDNRLNYVADFDGDGRAELMISSPWGLGILERSGGTFSAITMSPNGTRFGGWLLNTADNDLEAGLGQSYGLIIYHPDWTGAVNNTTTFLRNRGFTVFATNDVTVGLTELHRLGLITKASDRVFVYLAGHGATYRALRDHTKEAALTHILQFGDGSIVYYSAFAPWFKRMGATGAEVTVFDGSCDGGETVMDAIGEKYLGLSTTSVHAPGITNTPDPSNLMSRVGRPNSFGLWWSKEKTASLMTSQVPHRFFQKIYRSDDTEINQWSLFYKPAITFYQAVGGGWDLWTRGCYLYRYVYRSDYNALTPEQKAVMTVSADAYLDAMRADHDGCSLAITVLIGILNDAPLVARAADVYAAAYWLPWQTMFGDLSWDVEAEPVRNSPTGTPIEPRRYRGRDGFIMMVSEILWILWQFDRSYEEQETLLRQLDAEIIRRRFSTVFTDTVPPHLPKVTDYLEFNAFDGEQRVQLQQVVNKLDLTSAFVHDGFRVVHPLDDGPVLPDFGSPVARHGARFAGRATQYRSHLQEEELPAEVQQPEGLDLGLLRTHLRDRLVVRETVAKTDLAAAFALHRDDTLIEIGKHIPFELLTPSIDELVARLRAIQVADYLVLDRLYYMLTIAEEAISRASAKGVELADMVSF